MYIPVYIQWLVIQQRYLEFGYYPITVKLGTKTELIFTDGSLEIFEVKYSSQLTRTKNLLEHCVRFLWKLLTGAYPEDSEDQAENSNTCV